MRLAAALAVGALLAGAASAEGLRIGATTQFGQTWPASDWRLVLGSSIETIRDAIAWRKVEVVPGRYQFAEAAVGHIDRACRSGRRVLLVLIPRHPAYDDGGFVTSPAGRAAFAKFAAAVAARYGRCLVGIELGNEINARGAFPGAAAGDPVAAYLGVLRALRAAGSLGVPVLGGSTNAIAIGFLDRLFAGGMLSLVDGVVVHPYRRDPAGVDVELARLRDAMRRAGRVVPIWATEFGLPTTDERAAAAYLVEMATLMSAAGVAHADWYALVDRSPFPTMGLYRADGGAKMSADALDYLNRRVLPAGAARRESADPTLAHFRFGADRQVLWGLPRPFSVTGSAAFRDVAGRPIPRPAAIGETPFFVEGPARIVPGEANVLADSRLGFGRAPWSYGAQTPGRRLLPAGPIDWNWTSYLGSRALPNLVINPYDIVVPARVDVIVRYRADRAGPAIAAACLAPGDPRSAGATVELRQNGRALGSRSAIDQRRTTAIRLTTSPGDAVDFVLGGGDRAGHVRYRLRILRGIADQPSC